MQRLWEGPGIESHRPVYIEAGVERLPFRIYCASRAGLSLEDRRRSDRRLP